MKREIYILTVFIFSALFVGGAIFYFNNTTHTVFAAGAAIVQTTIRITVCGNNIKETGEQCDNADLGGASCVSRGFTGGTLSCSASCDFNTSACTSSGGGGGGGGGGAASDVPVPAEIKVVFSGRAYPSSKIIILKDGQSAATTVSGADAKFNITLGSLSTGSHTFSLYSEDQNGRRSSLLNFPLVFTTGATISVSGVFVSPTIDMDKKEVKRGDVLTIFGQSAPNSEITIAMASEKEVFNQAQADDTGLYSYSFDTAALEEGQHLTKARAAWQGEVTPFSQSLGFVVGTKNVLQEEEAVAIPGDINGDGRVNLIDFSILAYWYGRPNPMVAADLNHDGKINLVDFSILAYYWTG